MKKIFASLSVLMLALPGIHVQAQQILLSNYTYSENQPVIGTVVLSTGSLPRKITVKGTDAKLFFINQENQLVVRKPKRMLAATTYDIELSCETAVGLTQERFRIVRDQFNRNKVIAHRGAWKHTGASQNSIGSLQGAVKLGCMGSEFDVHMSADSLLFINHDHVIQEVAIEKTTSNQLAKIKLANGEFLSTLDAYLTAGMQQNKTRLILEIKASQISKERSLALATKVVQTVRALHAQAWVDYISFDYDICKRVKALNPYARVAYLNGDKSPDQLAADQLFGLDYHQSVMKKNENWIDEAQQKKLTVNVWTVNDPAMMDWLLAKKVDFITTDEPEVLLTKMK